MQLHHTRQDLLATRTLPWHSVLSVLPAHWHCPMLTLAQRSVHSSIREAARSKELLGPGRRLMAVLRPLGRTCAMLCSCAAEDARMMTAAHACMHAVLDAPLNALAGLAGLAPTTLSGSGSISMHGAVPQAHTHGYSRPATSSACCLSCKSAAASCGAVGMVHVHSATLLLGLYRVFM